MKIIASCMECLREDRKPSGLRAVDYFDNGIARFVCEKGHENAIVIQDPRFELLFQASLAALDDGFLYEAVACASASAERFCEFFIQVICASHSMPHDVYDDMYKGMSAQSERQLGAFMVLYATTFGKAYRYSPDRQKFRNDVIHKGRIPNHDEALKFVVDIYEFINNTYRELSINHAYHLNNVEAALVGKKYAEIKHEKRSTYSGPRIFGGEGAFDVAFNSFKQRYRPR